MSRGVCSWGLFLLSCAPECPGEGWSARFHTSCRMEGHECITHRLFGSGGQEGLQDSAVSKSLRGKKSQSHETFSSLCEEKIFPLLNRFFVKKYFHY